MATEERTLGNIEGRMAEQSALLHQLHADLTDGLQQVNVRIDRLMLAMLAIGGGQLVALIGVILALVVRDI